MYDSLKLSDSLHSLTFTWKRSQTRVHRRRVSKDLGIVAQDMRSLILLGFLALSVPVYGVLSDSDPNPPVWPEQFTAVQFQNRSGELAINELW